MRPRYLLSNFLYHESIFHDGSMRDWTEREWADINSRFRPARSRLRLSHYAKLIGHIRVPAVLSHISAAVVHQFPLPLQLVEQPQTHVTVSRLDVRPNRRNIVAHVGEIPPEEICVVDDLPVTSPARTIADLASVLTLPELNSALEQASRCEPSEYASDPVELLDQALRRTHFHGRTNLHRLMFMRRRTPHITFPDCWQSYLWMQIAISFRSFPALREIRDRTYLCFPADQVIVPEPYSYLDSRHTMIDRAEEVTYLRARGWHCAFYSFLDLTRPLLVERAYRSARAKGYFSYR